MDRMVISLIGLSNLSILVRAMMVTRYVRTPVLGSELATSDVMACGDLAGPIDYCAARVTDTTCELLTRDWCELKDMSIEGSYLLKRIITHLPEITDMNRYIRPVPINMTAGSEVEVKFGVRTGWEQFRCNLHDASDNLVLHTAVQPNSVYFKSNVGGLGPQKNILRNNSTVTEYTLNIRCDDSSFHIYLNSDFIWTYNSTPVRINSITYMDIKFKEPNGDLYYVMYKYAV